MSTDVPNELISVRRRLHERPEPAWREFYTTAVLLEELRTRDLDELHYGRDIHADGARLNVPDDEELDIWRSRAIDAGADPETVAELEDGFTGAIAVLKRGDGPTVGLRVDIDGLPILEADEEDHAPTAEGFRSKNEGYMHACGHDAHATIGLGVLDAIADSDFQGTLKVFFQPGEEAIVGGKPMAESGHLDDVDSLLAVHIGLDHPSGEVVAGIEGFLAVTQFRATFHGSPAHAGARPEEGDNAVQAMATAISNLYGIARHADGETRVNAGLVGGGTATNIIPEEAFIEGEVRGETTELMEYMVDRADTVLESAAEMHNCTVDLEELGEAPSAVSDDELISIVSSVAGETAGVSSVIDRDTLGGSEDATYLMQTVQAQGGTAAYVGVGTDHPGGHHTRTFDVVESDIQIAIDVLTGSIQRLADGS